MRLLMDEHGLDWEEAWAITSRTMAYTNHTLLPEALERWSVRLFRRLLPRLLDIIYEINRRFLEEVAQRWPGDSERLAPHVDHRGRGQMRRCAWPIWRSWRASRSTAWPHLHSELLQQDLFRDFYELWPDKFNNKTNGVTQRRWLASSNPALSELINRHHRRRLGNRSAAVATN